MPPAGSAQPRGSMTFAISGSRWSGSTPVLENNQPAYSYHGYALTDYYKIDPRFRTNEDFRCYVAGAGLSDVQRDMQRFVRTLFNWRKTSSAVRYGRLTHYIPSDGHYVYFRHDGKHTVMVVLNKNAQAGRLDLGRFTGMIKAARQGRNVLTGATVDLGAPLALPAMTSAVIAW